MLRQLWEVSVGITSLASRELLSHGARRLLLKVWCCCIRKCWFRVTMTQFLSWSYLKPQMIQGFSVIFVSTSINLLWAHQAQKLTASISDRIEALSSLVLVLGRPVPGWLLSCFFVASSQELEPLDFLLQEAWAPMAVATEASSKLRSNFRGSETKTSCQIGPATLYDRLSSVLWYRHV